jgi:hypothetical protein
VQITFLLTIKNNLIGRVSGQSLVWNYQDGNYQRELSAGIISGNYQRELSAGIIRGIISGNYQDNHNEQVNLFFLLLRWLFY